MSLEDCQHLGHKLPDRRTCVLLCEAFPACMPPAVRKLLHTTRTRLDHPDSSYRDRHAGDDCQMEASEQSQAVMTIRHLRRLAAIATTAHEDLCVVRPDLRGHLLAACLAQGGALHYVHRRGGIKDLDVWLFYAPTEQGRPAPYRRNIAYDFGPSEFGRHPQDDPARFAGRRVDVLCRTSSVEQGADPVDAVLAWLRRPGRSTWWLRKKPLVLVWPTARLGEVVWNPE